MNNLFNFEVQVYSPIQPFNEVVSKARCRVFYKYSNRNGSYITDEFAEKLIQSLPYTPVKGIYSNGEGDFTDHGAARDLGRIYGIVPEQPNFAWELFTDEDGIERNYACADVLLFTSLYPEAKEIVGNSLSMELSHEFSRGEWQFIDGRKQFVFTDGCFLGLQILGDGTLPCFEGASFYSLKEQIADLLDKLEQYNLYNSEEAKMDLILKVSGASDKFQQVWNSLNPNFTEDKEWELDYAVLQVEEDYALVFKYETNEFFKVIFAEDGAVETTDLLPNFSELQNQINELETSNSTLSMEKDTLAQELTDSKAENEALSKEVEGLQAYKLARENEAKEEVLQKYASLLDEEVIASYRSKIEEYDTPVALEKDLAFTLVTTNNSIFDSNQTIYSLKDNTDVTDGLSAILDLYK